MEIALGVVLALVILYVVAYFAVRAGDAPRRRSPTGDNSLDTSYYNADPPPPHHHHDGRP